MATVLPEKCQWNESPPVIPPVAYPCRTEVLTCWRVLSMMYTRAPYYCGNRESCCIDLKCDEVQSIEELNRHPPVWVSISIGAMPNATIAFGSRRGGDEVYLRGKERPTAFVNFDEKIRRFRRQWLTRLYNGNVVEIRCFLVSIGDVHFLGFASSIDHCFAFHSDVTDDPIKGVRCCHITSFDFLSEKEAKATQAVRRQE